MWADKIIVRKGTGCSPYFMVTEVYPTIPLDVVMASKISREDDLEHRIDRITGFGLG